MGGGSERGEERERKWGEKESLPLQRGLGGLLPCLATVKPFRKQPRCEENNNQPEVHSVGESTK